MEQLQFSSFKNFNNFIEWENYIKNVFENFVLSSKDKNIIEYYIHTTKIGYFNLNTNTGWAMFEEEYKELKKLGTFIDKKSIEKYYCNIKDIWQDSYTIYLDKYFIDLKSIKTSLKKLYKTLEKELTFLNLHSIKYDIIDRCNTVVEFINCTTKCMEKAFKTKETHYLKQSSVFLNNTNNEYFSNNTLGKSYDVLQDSDLYNIQCDLNIDKNVIKDKIKKVNDALKDFSCNFKLLLNNVNYINN